MNKKLVFVLFTIIACMFYITPAASGYATYQVTYAAGSAQLADSALLESTYYPNWKSNFVVTAGAYQRVRYPEGLNNNAVYGGTASEGIGYGMLLAVWFDDQPLFNNLWNYKVQHSVKGGLMAWLVDQNGNNLDPNSATDADEDIAMALILAHRRWGSSGVNYNSLASLEIGKISSQDIDTTDFHPYPGDYCTHASNTNTYPSYFTPAWYREFGIQSGDTTTWNKVIARTWTMLTTGGTRSGTTGLATELCTANGGAVSNIDSYNSCRIPWRYSLDYCWNTDANALAQIKLNAAFFNGSATTCGAGYDINAANNGVRQDATHNGSRVGPVTTAFMYSTAPAGQLQAFYNDAVAQQSDTGHFYNVSLALLGMLQATGNCPRMFGAAQPTPTPKQGDLFDDCEDGDNVNMWGGYWYTYDDNDNNNKGTSLVVPWSDNHSATAGKTPTPFSMQAPGYPTSPYGTVFGARMTGNVTTACAWGFIGMGSGTSADSGSPTYAVKDLTVYGLAAGGFRFKVKTNDIKHYTVKISCPASVTSAAGADYNFDFAGSTAWSQVDVPFSALTQPTWRTIIMDKALVLRNATDLQWQTVGQPTTQFDIMVDDIEFYPALPATPTPTYCVGEKLDSMEDGDNMNEFGGFWYTYANDTGTAKASTIWPDSPHGVTFTMSAPGANGSLFCARITGTVSNATVPFVGMGTNMRSDGSSANMGGFIGLTFWAKGDGNLYSVKLKSDPTVITGGNEFKYTFRSTIGASEGWEQMNIPFSIFTQERGWGTKTTVALVLAKLQQIQFESKGPSHTVDFSVDDVEFECSQNWTPTATKTTQPASPTNTESWTPSPAITSTFTGTRTSTVTPSFTKTDTPYYSPTDTRTPVPPTETWTASPAFTATDTMTPLPPTSTFSVSPIASATNTPLPATATNTPMPPTMTNTPLPPTSTNTPIPPTLTFTPIPPSPTITNTPDTSLPVDVLIDDCNDGDNANLHGGYWYAFDDAGTGLSYTDPVSDKRAVVDGRPTETFMMKAPDHTTGMSGGAAKVTGAVINTAADIAAGKGYGFIGMGTNLAQPEMPKDIGCCSGISFYARSSSSTMTSFRMKLGHPNAFTPPNPSENMYGKAFPLTSTWTLITIPFSDLTQLPWWGTTILRTDALKFVNSIQFQSTAPDNTNVAGIDLEVDDLTIYNCVGGCMPTPLPTVVIPPTPTITPTPNAPLVDFLVDDCTDGDNANKLGGYWYTFDDANASTHSYVWPMSDKWGVIKAVPTYAFIMSAPGYNSTGFAAQMTGTTTNELLSGTSYIDFLGMGTNLSEPKGPIQLNCCGGVRFYAKSDTPGVMANFRVKLGATAAYALAGGEGGDMYGKEFTVTNTWQLYQIGFDSFTAEGWGATNYPGNQPSRAQALAQADSIQFQSTGQGKANIDLWVDDLYLTNCYSGCVAAPPAPTSTNTPNIPATATNTPYIGPSATNTPIVPTATNTPYIPGGPTATNTPYIPGGATATPTAMPVSDVLEIVPGTVVVYPNPAMNDTDPIIIRFLLRKEASEATVRVFTSGMRLVREAKVTLPMSGPSGNILGAMGPVSGGGTCYIGLKYDFIKPLSKGTYYFVIDVKKGSETAKSKVEKIIKLK